MSKRSLVTTDLVRRAKKQARKAQKYSLFDEPPNGGEEFGGF